MTLRIESDWADRKTKRNRALIRLELVKELKNYHKNKPNDPLSSEQNKLNKKNLLLLKNLSRRPHFPEFTISVSHCPIAGGFVLCPTHRFQLGLDLEEAKRINLKLLTRTHTTDEISIAPQPHLLWSCKEAIFKSMQGFQPKTLTQITISQWKKRGQSWEFKAAIDGIPQPHLYGLVTEIGSLIIGIAKFQPQL